MSQELLEHLIVCGVRYMIQNPKEGDLPYLHKLMDCLDELTFRTEETVLFDLASSPYAHLLQLREERLKEDERRGLTPLSEEERGLPVTREDSPLVTLEASVECRVEEIITDIYNCGGIAPMGRAFQSLSPSEIPVFLAKLDERIPFLPENLLPHYYQFREEKMQEAMGSTPVGHYRSRREESLSRQLTVPSAPQLHSTIAHLLADGISLVEQTPETLLPILQSLPDTEDWYALAHYLLWYPAHRETMMYILHERLSEKEGSDLLREVVLSTLDCGGKSTVCLRPSDFGPIPDNTDVHRAVYCLEDEKGWKSLMRGVPRDEAPEHLLEYASLCPIGDLLREMVEVLSRTGHVQFVGDYTDRLLSLVRLPYHCIGEKGGLYAYRLSDSTSAADLVYVELADMQFLRTAHF